MKGVILLFAFLFMGFSSFCQDRFKNVRELTFGELLQEVFKGNLEFLTEKYKVTSAEALVTAAKAFQDPELEMIFPRFKRNEFSEFPKNIEFELSVPVELFGKRKYRIKEARAEELAAGADLELFLVRLKAETARVFVDGLRHQVLLEKAEEAFIRLQDFKSIREKPEADNIQERLEVLQTRMEERYLKAELLGLKENLVEAKYRAYRLLGAISEDSLVFAGSLSLLSIGPDLEGLLTHLPETPDMRGDKLTVEAAEYYVKRARAERLPDIDLILGYANEEAITPLPSNAFFGGLVLPLKISGLNKGEYRVSLNRLEQANIAAQATAINQEIELREKWEKFRLLEKKASLYSTGVVEEAKEARNLTLEQYLRKEVTLLIAFEAERNLKEVFTRYYDILSEYKKALIDISSVSGTWLVEF